MKDSVVTALALVFIAFSILAAPAFAYLDSGTGAFIVQMIMGSAMGILVVLTRFRNKVFALVQKLLKQSPAEKLENEEQ